MANEDKKDFNAMLHDSKDMPKFQTITDQKSIEKYGGSRMYFAPPIDYDKVMKLIPYGKVITVGKIREYFAELNGADFTEPITAGIFVSIAAWASYQRSEDETPYWRTLKANGELNAKYPGGIEAQKERLEAEGHTIIQKGRTNISIRLPMCVSMENWNNTVLPIRQISPVRRQSNRPLPITTGITASERRQYIRFWNNSVMTGCFMCLRARSGKRIGMGVFPAITKPGRKPFRSTRTRTASAKIGMFTLWWIVATPDLSISFLRRPGSIIQRNMGRKSRSAKA